MRLPAPDERIWVGVLRLVVEVPASRSLKDKRRAVRRIRDRLRSRPHLSAAEVGHLEDRARAVIAVTTVGNDPREVRATLERVAAEVPAWSEVLVADAEVELVRAFRGFGGG